MRVNGDGILMLATLVTMRAAGGGETILRDGVKYIYTAFLQSPCWEAAAWFHLICLLTTPLSGDRSNMKASLGLFKCSVLLPYQ